ncbi:MAG: peptidase M19 [Hydrotalea sp. AMD]|uniref:dipeptidase n=1 Tax=Hydrotalea sp. AMD TaxID=2501297 RepID=UPI000942EBB9|nr:membrane dipeptidase [Hydrotalea sp. AMD]RWZ86338.1 MAG: peptidase M19 [Hydrotalea sp. AMD]
MFLIDAHLDLSMNAMEWNRDLRMPVHHIRATETGLTDKPDRGKGTVSLPALRSGNIGLVVATLIGRVQLPGQPLPGWASAEQAWAQIQGQLAWYQAMEAAGELTIIRNQQQLQEHLTVWATDTIPNQQKVIGVIISLEGADALITPEHALLLQQQGLISIGPAHYGPGRYANGTDATGHLTENGKALLQIMQDHHIVLDITHLCDDALSDALTLYNGTLWASHHNCRVLVPHNRQMSDAVIHEMITRNSVIGMAFDAWMMVSGWQRGISTSQQMHCNIAAIIPHIDHICQIAGNSLHVGIGSDLDGAFGTEQSPYDLDTIADLQQLSYLLEQKGYTVSDIENIFHKNWLRMFQLALPK